MQHDNTNPPVQEDLNEVMRVRREKLDKLRESDSDPFLITTAERTHSSKAVFEGFDKLEGAAVAVAGRLMSKRVMGKASFAHVMDREGMLQIYIKRDDIGTEAYDNFKAMDIGDIISAEGTVFRTKAGEISLHISEIKLLSKSLRPLPEKFHGLKDPDLRYRQRYTDLIVNPEVRRTFEVSNKIYTLVRQYLNTLDFIEVQTPILHTLSSSAAARPFETKHNTLDIPMYLRIEMETYLKRLIVGGLERVYEIGRIFRNEGMSVKHNPEFTMLELYEAYTDYHGMMERVEGLFSYIAMQLNGTTKVTYQGVELDFAPPWKCVSMAEAVRELTGVDFDAITSDEEARAAAKAAGVHVEDKFTKGQALFEVFDELVEPTLVQPTFITEYPIEISPFAKRVPGKPMFTERFEFFIYGREGGNAFSELNDPIDQLERFIVQYNTRMAGDGDAQVDYDYVNALEIGLPPTGGVGIGMDRLVMLFTDSYSIRDVLLFPTMKPR